MLKLLCTSSAAYRRATARQSSSLLFNTRSTSKRCYSDQKHRFIELVALKNIREQRKKSLEEGIEFEDVHSEEYRRKEKERRQQIKSNTTVPPVTTEPLDIDAFNALFNRAEEAFYQNKLSLASKLYTECLRSNPEDGFVLAQRARVYSFKGELELAMKDYDKSIALLENEDSEVLADNYFNRGVVYFNQKSYSKALADYNRAVEIVQKLRNSQVTSPDLDQIIVNALNNRAYIAMNHASEISTEELQRINILSDLTFCIQTYEDAGTDPIEFQQIYYNRAREYQHLKRFEDAIEDYKEFLSIFGETKTKKHVSAHSATADCLIELFRLEEARYHIDLCIEYLNSKNIEKSDPAYERRNNQLSVLYEKRALSFLADDQLYEQKKTEALDNLSKAIEYNRRSLRTWTIRALVYIRYFEDYEAALFDLNVGLIRFDSRLMGTQTISIMDPLLRKEDLLYLRGYCHEKLDNESSALSDYSTLLSDLKNDREKIAAENEPKDTLPMELFIYLNCMNPYSVIVPRVGEDKLRFMAQLSTKVAAMHISQGKELITEKQVLDFSPFITKSLKELRRAISYDPYCSEAYFQRAQLYIQLYAQREALIKKDEFAENEYYQLAVDDLTKLIEISGDEIQLEYALFNRAVIYFKNHNFLQTVEDLKRYLGEFPEDKLKRARVQRIIAISYFKMGFYTEAMKAFYKSDP